jgi:hypothetical protein
MSDTTTQLQHTDSPGGDLMDEELITQAGDGITQAKRPRVVVAGKTGASIVDPVAVDPGPSPYSLPALGMALVSDTPNNYKDMELRPVSITPEGRVRVSMVAAAMDPDYFGDEPKLIDEPHYFGAVEYY